MLCEICGIREGVQTTVIINNVKTTRCICRECSLRKIQEREQRLRERQLEDEFGEFLGQSILAQQFGMFPLGAMFQTVPKAPPKEYTCEHCGRTSAEFRETALVGCPYCYEAFSPIMKQVLAECQPKTSHVGKAPFGKENVNAEYERLLKLLDRAVFEEKYAEAAEIQRELEKLKKS